MYFTMSNQLGIILPKKDFCTKKFMWAIILGIKRFMTKEEDISGLEFLEHKPGVVIKENSIKYWCDYLDEFEGWEQFIPDAYIKKIEKQEAIQDVEKRDYIPFDSHYLLSVTFYQLVIIYLGIQKP